MNVRASVTYAGAEGSVCSRVCVYLWRAVCVKNDFFPPVNLCIRGDGPFSGRRIVFYGGREVHSQFALRGSHFALRGSRFALRGSPVRAS